MSRAQNEPAFKAKLNEVEGQIVSLIAKKNNP